MHQQTDPDADDSIIDIDLSDYTSVGGTDFSLNDDGSITIILDDVPTWPLPIGTGGGQGGSASGGGGQFQPSGTVPVGNAKISGTPKLNFAQGAQTVKTNISYVIVTDDSSTLELAEQNPITPKEMIGITKFVNTVAAYMAVVVAAPRPGVVDISWTDLMDNLGIRRHFTLGPAKDQYDINGDTIYIFLYDA
jgi:hypothetical protein